MNKKQLIIFAIIIIIAVILTQSWDKISKGLKIGSSTSNNSQQTPPDKTDGPDIQNLTYNIDGTDITLEDGMFEANITDSASAEITEILTSTDGEMNQDGLIETAVVLVQSGAGTGTFYSLSVAYTTSKSARTTPAIFLGDRVDDIKLQIDNAGLLTVTYLERKIDDPMSAEPSVQVRKHFTLKNGTLVEK